MTRRGHEVGGGRAYQHEEEANFRSRGEVAHELLWAMEDVGDGDNELKSILKYAKSKYYWV